MSISKLITLITLFFLLGTSSWAGVETKIKLTDIPEAIIKTVKQQFPEAQLISANTETENNGKSVYEIQGILKDGRKFDYDISKAGQVEEIEIEFSVYMVPIAVMNAIEKKLPGFNATFIEASHSPSMKVVAYEFVGSFRGQKIDINVSADGSRIEFADQ